MKKKPDFLERPLDYTRTPRRSEFLREEYPTHPGDRWVWNTTLVGFGFVLGFVAAGWL